jgi:SAM-dependent methyltransferase
MSQADQVDRHVARNIKAYAKRAATYDERHGEIFTGQEQRRLYEALVRASAAVRSGGREALDFGAGSGNVTRHMIALGYDVTAADVSPEFLRTIEARFQVPTVELTGGALEALSAGPYDLIGVYSVLHHIPDYLAVTAELVTKLKPGGVLLIDHERNDNHWFPPPDLAEFRREVARARTGALWDPDHIRWQHLVRAAVTPSRHWARLNRLRRIAEEGDIHVYLDDHIEWDHVIQVLRDAGADLLERMDYLLFEARYDQELWDRYQSRCDDVTGVIVRRAL